MRAFLVGVLLAGCGYQPSSFRSDVQFPGQRATAGCLDISIERRDRSTSGEVVFAYTFGNRCDRPVIVDLASVTVIGRQTDGKPLVLHPYDPHREIEPRWLDGRAVGRETLAYEASVMLVDICVDAGSIPRSPMSWWLCFASTKPQRPEVP
jgi:hypothetical protein